MDKDKILEEDISPEDYFSPGKFSKSSNFILLLEGGMLEKEFARFCNCKTELETN